MNKDEILEKSRRDNDGMDERFKLMQWRASYLMLSVMMVVWALLFLWDSLHGQSTDVSFAIVMSGIAAMNFYQFYQFRYKTAGHFMIKLPSLGFDDVHDNDGELELCNRLKAARAEAGLSQAELAGLVGISRQTISSIETGLFNPTAKLALVLCIALDKKFEDLFYFE